MDFIIDIQDFHDAFVLGETQILTETLIQAYDSLNKGDRVIIQKQYSNAQSRQVKVITNSYELVKWKHHLEKILQPSLLK